ncbi:hypothetical protein A4R35_10865 [Thermogemmatispora tikiterensis]|uniref:Uncharacterized protein n=1 Tax=Thermogemmatispora tikiterensis TaxID=1825093 RepID=A0A328VED1_9CHLR|nr:hypothetical protein A4R35_10865 [Thermogemmatispora tikiterensis]
MINSLIITYTRLFASWQQERVKRIAPFPRSLHLTTLALTVPAENRALAMLTPLTTLLHYITCRGAEPDT